MTTKKDSLTVKADNQKAKLKKADILQNVDVVLLGKGRNLHFNVPLGHSYKINDKLTIKPEVKNVFCVKRWGRKDKFVTIFDTEGKPVTLKPQYVDVTTKDKNGKEVTTRQPQRVTAETLHIAEKSQSLQNGLADLFTDPANTKKIMFIVILAAIGVVAYMFLSGAVVV